MMEDAKKTEKGEKEREIETEENDKTPEEPNRNRK